MRLLFGNYSYDYCYDDYQKRPFGIGSWMWDSPVYARVRLFM